MFYKAKRKVPLGEIIPDHYVDINSHLLPAMDNGVATIYQAAYILEQFQEMGIKKVITTPQVTQNTWPNSSTKIKQQLEETQQVLQTLKITGIELQVAAEYMVDELFNQLITDQDILPIHKNYVLIQTPEKKPPTMLTEVLFELNKKNYQPILAHPERYSYYQNDFDTYKDLKEKGVLFQLNLLSITGFYGDEIKETSLKLISENLVDFVGTDIHNYDQLHHLQNGFIPKHAHVISRLMEKNELFY